MIFFLVTTTIDTDKGLGIILPPPGDMEIEIRKENILNCLINSQGKVLIDEEPTNVEQIHRIVGDRLRENDKLVVSVKAHKKTAPVANDVMRNGILLGCHQGLRSSDLKYISNTFKKFAKMKKIS